MVQHKTGDLIKEIAEALYPYNYSVSGDEAFDAAKAYMSYADFNLHTFESGSEQNGWIIPYGWRVLEAKVQCHGGVLHDCLAQSSLGCAYLSPSFEGIVTRDELLRHCSWRDDLPDAIVYDWTRLYRQGSQSWGLSIPWNILRHLPESELKITIKTECYPSKMAVLDLLIPGELDEEVLINAHNCHPYQANDDISGCATALAFFISKLQSKKNLYSYRLLIGPELYGPIFWAERNPDIARNVKSCILLKSVGNSASLKVQNSYTGVSRIDKILEGAVGSEALQAEVRFYPFRSYYGNDETVFEATGLEIPTVSLTRFPFPEYHTNLDAPSILSTESLQETYNLLSAIHEIIETDMVASSVAPGLHCLSNPLYNLYRKAPEPGISNDGISEYEKKWNLLMNCLSRDLTGGASILDISLKYRLPYRAVYDYVIKWHQKGLVNLVHSQL
jgi:aminopeptidase-like protein